MLLSCWWHPTASMLRSAFLGLPTYTSCCHSCDSNRVDVSLQEMYMLHVAVTAMLGGKSSHHTLTSAAAAADTRCESVSAASPQIEMWCTTGERWCKCTGCGTVYCSSYWYSCGHCRRLCQHKGHHHRSVESTSAVGTSADHCCLQCVTLGI